MEKPDILPSLYPDNGGKKCLVLDLNETLVHLSFQAVPGTDFVIPVQVPLDSPFINLCKSTRFT